MWWGATRGRTGSARPAVARAGWVLVRVRAWAATWAPNAPGAAGPAAATLEGAARVAGSQLPVRRETTLRPKPRHAAYSTSGDVRRYLDSGWNLALVHEHTRSNGFPLLALAALAAPARRSKERPFRVVRGGLQLRVRPVPSEARGGGARARRGAAAQALPRARVRRVRRSRQGDF